MRRKRDKYRLTIDEINAALDQGKSVFLFARDRRVTARKLAEAALRRLTLSREQLKSGLEKVDQQIRNERVSGEEEKEA